MKEFTNLEIAMLSPVKRQIYLKRQKRARIKLMARIELVPFVYPVNGHMFWMPLDRARAMAEAFSNVEELCRAQKQLSVDDMLAECYEES